MINVEVMLISNLQNNVGKRFPGGRIRRRPDWKVCLSFNLVLEEANVAT
jgi:hypothetical protein